MLSGVPFANIDWLHIMHCSLQEISHLDLQHEIDVSAKSMERPWSHSGALT